MSNVTELFAARVFDDAVMRQRLPKETYKALRQAMRIGKRLDMDVAAVVANAIGTIPSVLIALFLSRGIAAVAVYMGPWEFFSLGMCAIVMVASLSKGNAVKGLLAAAMGLAFSTVGTAPVDGTMRFTFDNFHLFGGLSIMYVVMGVFASRAILVEYAKRDINKKQVMMKVSKFKWPILDILNNKRIIFESWFIGLWIGFLPGLGPGLSNLTAYARAQASSKTPEEFGKGHVGGVFAPEVANNASLGGAMIPMVALGIPGDTGTAYLLGALMLHGLEPGPLLFATEPLIANIVFLASAIAGVYALTAEILGMRLFPKILNLPYHYLYPAIILFCFLGVFSGTKSVFGVGMLLLFTCFGVLIAYANMPTAPFVLAFVLGSILETNFRRALTYANNGWFSFFTRPVSCILLLVALYFLVSPMIKDYMKRKKAAAAVEEEESEND